MPSSVAWTVPLHRDPPLLGMRGIRDGAWQHCIVGRGGGDADQDQKLNKKFFVRFDETESTYYYKGFFVLLTFPHSYLLSAVVASHEVG